MTKIRIAVAAAAIAAISSVPVAPAQATSHDCIILGPNYVDEVVDCAVWIVERAIQW